MLKLQNKILLLGQFNQRLLTQCNTTFWSISFKAAICNFYNLFFFFRFAKSITMKRLRSYTSCLCYYCGLKKFTAPIKNSQSQEHLSAVNQTSERVAKCANSGETIQHYRKLFIGNQPQHSQQALEMGRSSSTAERKWGEGVWCTQS